MSLDASEDVVAPPGVVADSTIVDAIFEETQFFHPFFYALTIAIGLVCLIAVGSALVSEAQPAAGATIAIIALLGTGFALNLLLLRTRVSAGELYVALGWVPVLSVRISVPDLKEGRVVQYRPIWDAGGWGLRFGRFDGHACRYWNARGNRGVFIAGPKRRYIIGSQKPEELYRALVAAGMGANR